MGISPAQVVSEIGKKLSKESRPSKDFIVKSLKNAEDALSKLDQSSTLKSVISPLSDFLVNQFLLQHRDKDVRLLVTICLSEVIRVLAPEPPFNDGLIRDVFKLMVLVFTELDDTTSPYFLRRVKIVETIADLKFCFQVLDIGCDDLIVEMFSTFFSVVREHHPQSLVSAILSIMTLILKEEVSRPLLEVIFRNLLREGKGVAPASYCLAVSVIKNCSKDLESYFCGFLASCISDKDAVESDLKDFYHEIIFEIFQCTPDMLLDIIPTLSRELLTDQVDTRIKAVNLIGKLFALPARNVAHGYRHLYEEFLKRFSDKSAEVRVIALQCAKACYLVNPLRSESLDILAAIEGRLLDFDERVRIQAVVSACDLAKSTLEYVSVDLVSRVIERLRDKKLSVRKNALCKLLEVYREYCTMCSEDKKTIIDHFEQIPCKILILCYDKDCKEFRPQNLEIVLAEDLFPASLSVVGRTKHWIYIFSLFTPAHVKALNSILSQKRRLQIEMRGYLTLRMKQKENGLEVQDRVRASFMKMSASFPDPHKADECFHKLDKMKDNNIFDTMVQLLDEVTSVTAQNVRDKLAKMIGDKHPQFSFLCSLFARCSNNIFNSDHVSCILDNISCNLFENRNLAAHSTSLLTAIVTIFPSLLRGCEKKFQNLLLEENSFNDKLLHMLTKVGSQISVKLSDIFPCLERLCLEGTRTQAKISVSAISATGKGSEQLFFAELLEKLVDCLHAGKNIPTVLQSLGCIAQHSVSTFQMQDRAIKQYINDEIFQAIDEKSNVLPSFDERDISGCSLSCKLKIYALKTSVKTFLPHHGAHVTCHITDLLNILSNMLEKGEVFDGTVSGENDKDHIRVAAAKSVLRISRKWDFHIYPQIFQSTIMMAKYSSSFVRRLFVDKVHKLLTKHAISNRYACAFTLATSDSFIDIRDHSLKYLAEFIRQNSREAPMHQDSEIQGESITDHPAYIMVYLIHVLAHDTAFPPESCLDEEIYAYVCRPLLLALWALVNANFVDGDVNIIKDAVSHLLIIFRAISKAEDAVDDGITPKLHALSDVGMSILYTLNNYGITLSHTQRKILLPSSLYRSHIAKTSEKASLICHAPYVFEENFIQRVVNILKLQMSPEIDVLTIEKKEEIKSVLNREIKSQKIMRQKTNTRAQQRQIISTLTSSIVDGNINGRFGNSRRILEQEHLLSSCDSVSDPSVKGAQVTDKVDLVGSSSLKENGMIITSNTEERSKCCGAELKDRCSSKDIMQKSRASVGRIELLCSDDDWEPEKHSFLTSQHQTIDMLGDDTSQPQEYMGKEKKLHKIVVPLPVKRKKGQSLYMETSLSSLVDVNSDIIGPRTRNRARKV